MKLEDRQTERERERAFIFLATVTIDGAEPHRGRRGGCGADSAACGARGVVTTLPSIRASRATAHMAVVQQVLGISGRPDATEDQHSDSHRALVRLPYTLLCDQQILSPGTRCAGR